jgi:hypothetical protein
MDQGKENRGPDLGSKISEKPRVWALELVRLRIPPQDDELNALPCKHEFHTECLLPWLQVITTRQPGTEIYDTGTELRVPVSCTCYGTVLESIF